MDREKVNALRAQVDNQIVKLVAAWQAICAAASDKRQ